MELGMIGLGKMGANMTERLANGGHDIVAYDRNPEAVEQAVEKGARGAESLEDLVGLLSTPKYVWVMVPAGEPTNSTRPQHFLRVVNRVYLAAKVDILLTDQSTAGAGVDAGAAPRLSVQQLAVENTETNFETLNKALDKAVPSGAAPGGSLRLSASSGRTVSLVETFPRLGASWSAP